MKWGRKKASSSSSSPISAITRAFPFPWFSKSKKKGATFDQCDTKKKKQRCGPGFSTPKSCNWREGRLYSMDEDESFWRLSFSDDRKHGRKSTGGINPLWYDHDHGLRRHDEDHDHEFLKEECRNFSDMVMDVKKMRENRGKQRKTGDPSPRRRDTSELVSRKSKDEKTPNPYERDVFPIETEESSVSEWLDFEGRKLKELKIKTESKKKNRGIKKAYSPRTECKIKALEEMKKTRSKKKEKVLEGSTVFDSFAVVKSSYDPPRDFRDSMVEMIRERGIGHPQDLEELLACYLTLNRDEYHDMIIKVFRQVWFELKGVYIDPPIRNGSIFDY